MAAWDAWLRGLEVAARQHLTSVRAKSLVVRHATGGVGGPISRDRTEHAHHASLLSVSLVKWPLLARLISGGNALRKGTFVAEPAAMFGHLEHIAFAVLAQY